MKTYVLTVSRTFPKTHKRAGQQTWFVEKINEARMPISDEPIMGKKIHTIRANYDLWKKRIDEVNAGNAILSLRYWTGKPYNSKQQEFLQLTNDDGISVQKLSFFESDIYCPYVYGLNGSSNEPVDDVRDIAKNDGLSIDDFEAWFKGYDISKPMAIIHFSKFRY